MSAAPHLRVVDVGTGEMSNCAGCQRLQDLLAESERHVRNLTYRNRDLERDLVQDARESPLWPVAALVFRGWQRLCDHPRSRFTEDRFWLCEPFLSLTKWGPTLEARVVQCCVAVKGAAFDAWSKPRRNGTTYVHDGWDVIFGAKSFGRQRPSADGFEGFVKRAPVGWEPRFSEDMRLAIAVADERLVAVEKARKGRAA